MRVSLTKATWHLPVDLPLIGQSAFSVDKTVSGLTFCLAMLLSSAVLAQSKPLLLEAFHDWSAYTTLGKEKTCYALANPKDRSSNALKREEAYVFISDRPNENV